MLEKEIKRLKRHSRIRSILSGTNLRPRVVVYKSNTRTYVQAVDDTSGKVVLAQDITSIKDKVTPLEKCTLMGKLFGAEIKKLKIEEIVFDRNGYKYHGKVQAIASGLRESGLKF
jgi:large subunit ribosomal protein L18